MASSFRSLVGMARPGRSAAMASGPFSFATLLQPTGAEDRPGPEFDVLRATIARYGTDPEFALKAATFREVDRDASSVVFLGDRGIPRAHSHRSVSPSMAPAGDGPRRAAGVDSTVSRATPGAERTGRSTRHFASRRRSVARCTFSSAKSTAHLRSRSTGRLAPAYVFLEPGTVRIQVFVLAKKPRGSCRGVEADRRQRDASRAARVTQARGRDTGAVPGLGG